MTLEILLGKVVLSQDHHQKECSRASSFESLILVPGGVVEQPPLQQQSKKRKTLGDTLTQTAEEGIQPDAFWDLQKKVDELARFVKDNRNVHKEVKRWALEITGLVKRATKEYKRITETNRNLEMRDIDDKKNTQTRDIGTQTQTRKEARAEVDLQETRKQLEQASKGEDLYEWAQENWPEESYLKTATIQGDVQQLLTRHCTALEVDTGSLEENNLLKRLYKINPGLEGAIDRKFEVGQVTRTTITNSFDTESESDTLDYVRHITHTYHR